MTTSILTSSYIANLCLKLATDARAHTKKITIRKLKSKTLEKENCLKSEKSSFSRVKCSFLQSVIKKKIIKTPVQRIFSRFLV